MRVIKAGLIEDVRAGRSIVAAEGAALIRCCTSVGVRGFEAVASDTVAVCRKMVSSAPGGTRSCWLVVGAFIGSSVGERSAKHELRSSLSVFGESGVNGSDAVMLSSDSFACWIFCTELVHANQALWEDISLTTATGTAPVLVVNFMILLVASRWLMIFLRGSRSALCKTGGMSSRYMSTLTLDHTTFWRCSSSRVERTVKSWRGHRQTVYRG